MKNPHQPHSTRYKILMALTALGVVYGDIGTSPLYALKEAFNPEHHMAVNETNVLGLLSLIFWSLMIVISFKYLFYILRADNRGEGGILALASLIAPRALQKPHNLPRYKKMLILVGLFGTALLYGDGVITPAISILSAVEGLSLITPVFDPYIIPITIFILIGLFSIQKKGTGTVGKIFGPITLIWFGVLAVLGLMNIIKVPQVLWALNPYYIFHFFIENTWHGFVVLGSVFLVVTGGEALYSDLGHFGKKPIKEAWFFVVLPSLVLNYFGQGAVILLNPAAISNPFYLMAPSWALYPLVILAAMATTIASQALITGVFSLTMQAFQNGFLPRIFISHTSTKEFGQIYIPTVNRFLMLGCLALVLTFQSSSHLASAYGFAVTTTMVITSILFYVVAHERWRWPLWKAILICALFLIIDLSFWGANLLKIVHGGWFPLLVGILGFTFLTTWKTGRRLLSERLQEKIIPLDEFLELIDHIKPFRAPGTAIYMIRSLKNTPYSLIHTFEHFKTVHRNLIFLSVFTEEVPRVSFSERVTIERIKDQNYRIILRYGYMEMPNIPRDIDELILGDFVLKAEHTTYVIGKENLFATDQPGMALWREKLFTFLSRNELSATNYFQLPKDRVVEIGTQIAI